MRRLWPFSRSIIITCIHAGSYASFHSASCHTQGMLASPVPDLDQRDKGALKALAIELQGELRQHRETLAQQEVELAALEAEFAIQRQKLAEQSDELRSRSDQIEHLKLLVEKLRRTIFGKKSEKIVVQLEQFELEREELETTQAAAETIADGVRPETAPQGRPKRKPLPAHLPRQAVTHTPEHTCCSDCGGFLKQFGEDASEQLEYVPESFKVIRHVRPKFACTACERVVEAPAPSRPIERGLAGPALLAHGTGFEVLRPPASLSPVGDLCAAGRRDRALHAGRLGGRIERVA